MIELRIWLAHPNDWIENLAGIIIELSIWWPQPKYWIDNLVATLLNWEFGCHSQIIELIELECGCDSEQVCGN